MTRLFEHAVATARELPEEVQDNLAQIILSLAGDDNSIVELTEEEARSFDESMEQADRGEFVSSEEMQALWSKHGL